VHFTSPIVGSNIFGHLASVLFSSVAVAFHGDLGSLVSRETRLGLSAAEILNYCLYGWVLDADKS